METFANHDNARTGREPFFTTQEPSINIDSPPIYAQSLPIQPSTRRPYKCLESLLPFLEGVIDSQAACELLDFYFAQPGNSLFQSASPYVLSHVVRKQSLLYAAQPRETTSALLSTMLWVSAQTADIPLLLLPGKRARVCETLRALAECLIEECNCGRECGHEKRQAGVTPPAFSSSSAGQIFANLPGKCDRSTAFPVDDVLTFVLFSIVVSGGDHKTNCYKWWNKAIMLARSSGLYSVDSDWSEASRSGLSHSSNHPKGDPTSMSLAALEAREERRRCFWLLFCLDRHLALSFNSTLSIADGEFEVFQPLPEDVWECLETAPIEALTHRVYGPLTTVTGIGFFEWFLALMSILGDIILVHHRRFHPRLGSLDDHEAVLMIEDILTKGAQSIADMRDLYEATAFETAEGPTRLGNSTLRDPGPTASQRSMKLAQVHLVTSYSTFMIHVLHVLLHGKWDAVSMLDNDDDWITSVPFMKCASHAIAASEAVSRILNCDPELSFMPYLFGIYLLHGSFILLLFADRMPQLGPNESVEKACETIIRAHEVCVVTLNTEFQVRSTLPLILSMSEGCPVKKRTDISITRNASARSFVRHCIV